MSSTIKEKMYIAAKKFAIETIIEPQNHPEAVEDFEENFIKGAEWLLKNIEQLKEKSITEFADTIDAAVENHANSLIIQCETSTFNEEEKDDLRDSFKYPFREGIDWAYDNNEE